MRIPGLNSAGDFNEHIIFSSYAGVEKMIMRINPEALRVNFSAYGRENLHDIQAPGVRVSELNVHKFLLHNLLRHSKLQKS